jgi:hypothetical protein
VSRRASNARSREHGFTTIQYVIAVAWSFVLLVLVANLLIDMYARGAVREALDDGVRAGASATAPVDACEARVREVVNGLVHGPLLNARVRCDASGAFVVATADVSLESWLPMLVPDWNMTLRAEALREP